MQPLLNNRVRLSGASKRAAARAHRRHQRQLVARGRDNLSHLATARDTWFSSY